MKIFEFNCPACGANLKCDTSRDVMYCEYCGKKLILDDESTHVKISIDNAREAGYEFENGRMNAQSDTALSEADRIKFMISSFPEYERLKSRYNAVTYQYNMCERRLSNKLPLVGWGLVCLLLVFIIFGNIIYLFSEPKFANVLAILVTAGIIALIIRSQQNLRIQLQKKKDDTMKLRGEVMAEINTLVRESDLDTIPEKIRTMECLNYIHNALISQIAYTVPQAIHNYELYQQQMALAEQNRQQLEIQKKQLKEIESMKKELKKKGR